MRLYDFCASGLDFDLQRFRLKLKNRCIKVIDKQTGRIAQSVGIAETGIGIQALHGYVQFGRVTFNEPSKCCELFLGHVNGRIRIRKAADDCIRITVLTADRKPAWHIMVGLTPVRFHWTEDALRICFLQTALEYL